jgi:hypothetical protein
MYLHYIRSQNVGESTKVLQILEDNLYLSKEGRKSHNKLVELINSLKEDIIDKRKKKTNDKEEKEEISDDNEDLAISDEENEDLDEEYNGETIFYDDIEEEQFKKSNIDLEENEKNHSSIDLLPLNYDDYQFEEDEYIIDQIEDNQIVNQFEDDQIINQSIDYQSGNISNMLIFTNI